MTGGETAWTLSAFAHELARAWQKLSLYQPGHPARAEVAALLEAQLAALAAPTGAVRLGVGRDAFVGLDGRIEGGAVAGLARALFDRGVALVRFDEGVEAADLESFLVQVPRPAPGDDEPPLWDRLADAGVRRVHAEPADFSAVVPAAEDGADGAGTGPPGRTRGLYETLVARLVSRDGLGDPDGLDEAAGDGSLDGLLRLVRRVLERHGVEAEAEGGARPPASAAAVLTPLAEELGGTAGRGLGSVAERPAREAVARQLAALLAALPPALREAVLDAALRELATGSDPEGLDALRGAVATADVVASLRRLRADGVAFSARVVGLVEDLAFEAAPRPADRAGLGREELTDELRRLLAEDGAGAGDPAAAGPDAHDRIALELRRLGPARVDPARFAPSLDTITEPQVTLQLARTLLDLVQRPGLDADAQAAVARRTERVVQALLASDRPASAVRIVHALRALAADPGRTEAVRRTTEACLERLGRREVMVALVESVATWPGDAAEPVGQLVELLGPVALRELLLAMCEEEDLGRRRKTFDVLAGLGRKVAPAAVALLADERWFVARNMLALLRRAGEPIPGPALRRALAHPDPRVRLEAVKSLGSSGDPVGEGALRGLLADPEPKVAESAARAIGTLGLAAGQVPLLELLRTSDPLGRQTPLRCAALAALGELGPPDALSELGHFFRGWLTVVTPDERRAAYAALAGYPREARAPWVEKGLRSSDPAVRETCRRLAGEGGR